MGRGAGRGARRDQAGVAMNDGSNFWTAERVELLKKAWADGFSASQIAEQVGARSRNSVIGKVHRLKLPSREKQNVPRVPRRRKPKDLAPNAPKHPWRDLSVPRVKPPTPVPVQPVQPVEASMENRRTILTLKHGECRWPHGDPRDKENFWFCGESQAPERPYCWKHCGMAYANPADRRRRRAA